MARHLNVGVGVLSAMFGCRALGAGVGSVGTGVAMDKLTQYSYTMYAFIIFLSMSGELSIEVLKSSTIKDSKLVTWSYQIIKLCWYI